MSFKQMREDSMRRRQAKDAAIAEAAQWDSHRHPDEHDEIADMEETYRAIAIADIATLSELGSEIAQNAALPDEGLSQKDAARIDAILRQIRSLAEWLEA